MPTSIFEAQSKRLEQFSLKHASKWMKHVSKWEGNSQHTCLEEEQVTGKVTVSWQWSSQNNSLLLK